MRVTSPTVPVRTAAMTLVEILVVVAVLVALASLSLPVFGAVRASAYQARCISNLRQCGTAHFAYAADNRGDLPLTTRQYGGSGSTTQIPWMLQLADYYQKTNNNSTASIDQTAACPAFRKVAWPVIGYTGGNIYAFWGYVRNNYLYQDGDANLLNQPNLTNGSQSGDWCQSGWCTPYNTRRLTYPSSRFLVGDGCNDEHNIKRVNSTITYNKTTPTTGQGALAYQYAYVVDGTNGNNIAGNAKVPKAMTGDAHRGKRSYGMCDGSVRHLNDSAMDNSNQWWLSIMDPKRL